MNNIKWKIAPIKVTFPGVAWTLIGATLLYHWNRSAAEYRRHRREMHRLQEARRVPRDSTERLVDQWTTAVEKLNEEQISKSNE